LLLGVCLTPRRDECLLAWQLQNALHLQAVALNWLQFSVSLARRRWTLWLPHCCFGSSTSPAAGVVTRAGGGEARPCCLGEVLHQLFRNGCYKWLRILGHVAAGAWERGRDAALGSFLTGFVLAESKMVSYESTSVRLGGAVPQEVCMQFCALQ